MRRIEPLREAFDYASEHVVITDADAHILYANRKAEEVTGYPLQEMLGRNPADLWGGQKGGDFWKRGWHRLKVEKKAFVAELQNRRKNGELYWQELHITPVLDDSGEPRFFIGFEPDITYRKKRELFQDSFLSVVAHQLTSPLTDIAMGLDELIETAQLKEDDSKMLRLLQVKNKELMQLVQDLLVLTRVGSGPQKSDRVDIGALVGRIVEELHGSFPAVRFSVTPPASPVIADAPPAFASQVLFNIIANAAKYSGSAQTVEVSFGRTGQEVRFVCRDRGIGIPKKDQPYIFTSSFRASNAGKQTGHGLGLYIVKMIAGEIGWGIGFESDEGKGTTFTVTIPLPKNSSMP